MWCKLVLLDIMSSSFLFWVNTGTDVAFSNGLSSRSIMSWLHEFTAIVIAIFVALFKTTLYCGIISQHQLCLIAKLKGKVLNG